MFGVYGLGFGKGLGFSVWVQGFGKGLGCRAQALGRAPRHTRNARSTPSYRPYMDMYPKKRAQKKANVSNLLGFVIRE